MEFYKADHNHEQYEEDVYSPAIMPVISCFDFRSQWQSASLAINK
jgi:hypothetical protein